jgi:CubicO group peptidase (beta-lactamase class C family)
MADSRFDEVWTLLENQRVGGRFPGYVAAIRLQGQTELRAGGTLAVGGTVAMAPDTIFRLASLTKLPAGVLALRLIHEGAFGLNDPAARWLPELAEPKVLRHPYAEITDTVAVQRPILVRHLLSLTFGLGMYMQPAPLQSVIDNLGVGAQKCPPAMPPDDFMARVGSLPLAFQPGDGWLYNTGSDVLGVLIARATGRSVGELLAEKITGPLGMDSTGFYAKDSSRLATGYQPIDGRLQIRDLPNSVYSRPPVFEALGCGLVSTVPDFLAFLGVFTESRDDILPAELRRLMTSDSLDDRERRDAQEMIGPGGSWGLQTEVDLAADEPWMVPGRFGWDGGTGTTAYVDPSRELTGILFTQRAMTGPTYDFAAFWTAVHHCAG